MKNVVELAMRIYLSFMYSMRWTGQKLMNVCSRFFTGMAGDNPILFLGKKDFDRPPLLLGHKILAPFAFYAPQPTTPTVACKS
jgi:hypothetical protein